MSYTQNTFSFRTENSGIKNNSFQNITDTQSIPKTPLSEVPQNSLKVLETKLLEQTHEITFLREELECKSEQNKRELENQRALLECEFTIKCRSIRDEIRKEFDLIAKENEMLKQKTSKLEEENKIIRTRFERSENYNKELEKMYTDIASKQEEIIREEKWKLNSNLEKELQFLLQQNEISVDKEIKRYEHDAKVSAMEVEKLQGRVREQGDEIQRLREEIHRLKMERQDLEIEISRVKKAGLDKGKALSMSNSRYVTSRPVSKEKPEKNDKFSELYLYSTVKMTQKENIQNFSQFSPKTQNSTIITMRNIEPPKYEYISSRKKEFAKKFLENGRNKNNLSRTEGKIFV